MLFCWYYCAYWRGCSPKDTSLRAYCTESQQEFLDQSLEELPGRRLPIVTTITSWDATKRRMKKSSPKSCRHYGKRPLYPKLSAALTDSRILEFETADGDTCLFWFDEKPVPWRRRNILCAFRRRGDLGSGAENSGNISGIQGSDGVKRQIEKAGCSLLVCS